MLIQGENIVLRHLHTNDLDDFYNYRSVKDALVYQDFMVSSREEAITFIEQQAKATLGTTGGWFQVAIALKETNQLIGDCGVQFDKDEPRKVEIGYTLNPKFQGHGYATQAVKLLTQLLFETHSVHKINALIDLRNEASLRLINRLNFKQEGHFVNNYWDKKDEKWYDELQFALINPKD